MSFKTCSSNKKSEIDTLKKTLEEQKKKLRDLQEIHIQTIEKYEEREKKLIEDYSKEIIVLKRRGKRHRRILEKLGVIRLTKFRIGENEIEKGKCIGSGGFGSVYEGEWKKDLKIAVKEISIKSSCNRQLVVNEFQMQTILVHPNILQVYGYAMPDEETFQIVMELMDMNLLDFVQKEKPMISQKLFIMKELVEGLKYLHDHRPVILHRDLKASNILISAGGKIVKITDFGLHKTMTSSRRFVKIDDTFGTLKWKAPELIDFGGTASKESDVYSLGITFWEILYESEPYAGASFKRIFEDVAVGKTRPDLKTCRNQESLPQDFEDLLKKMWHQDPDERPSTEFLFQWLEDAMNKYCFPGKDFRFPGDVGEEEVEGEYGSIEKGPIGNNNKNTSSSDSSTNWSVSTGEGNNY